jgi:hypothetical protein
MNKAILLFTIPFIVTTNVFSQVKENYSQDDDRKGFASINLGVSIPTGNFGSDNFNNNEAGFATSGAVFDISFGYKFRPKLGVTAVWRGQANGIDVGTYAQSLANFFGSGSVSVETSAYTLGGIMTGLYGSFPIAAKLSFEPRALVGLSNARLPAKTTVAYNSSGTQLVTWTQDQAETVTFSYIIGAGAKFDVSKKICLLFNVDFYSAKAEWENVREISVGHVTGTTEIRKYDYKQNFSTVNISAGFGFRF